MAEYKNIQNDYKQKFENFVRVTSSMLIIDYFYVIEFFFYQNLEKDELKAFRAFMKKRAKNDEDGGDDDDEDDGSNDEGDSSNEDSEPNGSNEERASGASSDED